MSLKNVLIMGDSYSTFKGYIPDEYDTYYSETDGKTDVRNVSETWWHQVLKETNSNLVLNNSWSGSTVCYTRYNNEDCSETSSFICRLNKLINEGFFNKNNINTVFIFGGTNDSCANAPIGDLKYSDWEKKDLYSVLPAVCYLINKFKETVPNARLIWLLNTELKPEVSEGIIKACEYYNIEYIQFKSIDKTSGHPTIKGMLDIKNQVLENI